MKTRRDWPLNDSLNILYVINRQKEDGMKKNEMETLSSSLPNIGIGPHDLTHVRREGQEELNHYIIL